jgi:copper/silver efflux system protein
MIDRLLRFCMEQKLVVMLVFAGLFFWGLLVSPFNLPLGNLPRDPVPVDAIPDLGENQQIVFTEWPGRSPQDIEDQITYPLTAQLLGIPGVKTVRSNSMFGFSSVYVIFKEDVEFYWSRSRILEKLNSLPNDTLPDSVSPALGPDATAMGQIFWYTLEGRSPDGEPTGGWDLHELRSIQDWYVRYALQSADGVSEVASIGGFQQEYQIDIDPDALRAYDLTVPQVIKAIRKSNLDVGARSIESNGVEYLIRGKGFLKSTKDISQIVLSANNGIPVTVEQVATVGLGPALRRGALDKAGAEAVGGVVVSRYGANPQLVIDNVKQKISELAPGLPRKTLEDGTVSQVTIIPYYDRTNLITETIGTLSRALHDQILITIIVVLLMVLHLRSSVLISLTLPLAVLLCFILMKLLDVQANVVALGGIAIAIGTVVDMGIVMTENMVSQLDKAPRGTPKLTVLHQAATEVGGAVLTAVATTIIGFLPVFYMIGAEGKLFKPLAYTKTFVLGGSILLALAFLPPLVVMVFGWRLPTLPTWARRSKKVIHGAIIASLALYLISLLARSWHPLGLLADQSQNFFFVLVLVVGLIGFFWLFQLVYGKLLRWCLDHKLLFILLPIFLVCTGISIWLGFSKAFSWVPKSFHESTLGNELAEAFPGMGQEFMPTLDEGSFLYMPVTMPHASIGEAMEYLQKLDMAVQAIPEVESVVGKLGRVESPLDPAPISMIETVIAYKSEFKQDAQGKRLTFAYNKETGEFLHDKSGELVPSSKGRPFRQWRDSIVTSDDIWNAIVEVAQFPGLTSAPKLAPISTRLVMLQSGMRAPMGVKVKGPDLKTIEETGFKIESILKNVEGVRASAVVAERVIGKPYLEINIDREQIARYGMNISDVQEVIETAIGGKPLTKTIEGRERYAVRIRYQRELRDSLEEIYNLVIPSPMMSQGKSVQVPLKELADIEYVRGPQSIKSENSSLVSYVLFDKESQWDEVSVIENARLALEEQLNPQLPAGVSYEFAGTYENRARAIKTLTLILPVTLLLIFLIIYLQFRSSIVTLIIFSGVFVAWSGGFLALWLWGEPWFMNLTVFGVNLRDLFQMETVNLSVAVWVGFLALFGIATDDGVVMATYIKQSLKTHSVHTIQDLREAVVKAGERRIRPCLMTSATTILALLPVLSSNGKGAEIIVPMAIPSFGGMLVVLISVFVVPTLYCAFVEAKYYSNKLREIQEQPPSSE